MTLIPSSSHSRLVALHQLGAALLLSLTILSQSLAIAAPGPYTVTATTDTGAGSLRQALTDAAANPGPDIITFDAALSGQTISAEVLILAGSGNVSAFVIDDADGVTIDGLNLPAGITLTKRDAAAACRLFHVRPGSSLTLIGLNLSNAGGAPPGSTEVTIPGGAIFNSGNLTLTRCTLNGHTGNTGGALYNGGSATLTQCTITDCIADTGAGIYSAGDLSVVHCTIANNDAQSVAGGIYANQPMNLEASIIAGNTGIEGADLYNPAIVTRNGTNLVEFYSSPLHFAGVGSFISAPALLAPLGSYGGPTLTMPPLPGSPATDQASDTSPLTTIDQRGAPRPLGAGPDLGSVEGRVVIVTTKVDELDPPGCPGTGYSLREAIRDISAGGTITFDRGLFNSVSTNTLSLTLGPLNAQRACTLDGSANPGGITILQSLTITTQPQPLSVSVNAPASFTVAATAVSGGLAYQWRKNDSAIATAATSATYSIASSQKTDEGLYDVVLSEAPTPGVVSLNSVTLTPVTATSQPARFAVGDPSVTILRQPVGGMITLGSSLTLSVVALAPSTPAATYKWFKNGRPVGGATKSTYTVAKAGLSNAGAYTCLVKSGASSATSAAAEVAIVDANPTVVFLPLGGSFRTKASAAGNGISYAWFKDGSSLSITTAELAIKPLTLGDNGLYTCTITGLAGTYTNGKPTQLHAIDAAPQLALPADLPEATVCQTYYYLIPVISTPGASASSFSASGLPAGLKLNSLTGVISGRPIATNPNGFTVVIKATNLSGSSTSSRVSLFVNPMPRSAIGTFTGPIERSPFNDNLGGRIDLTTTATGFFSGSIVLGTRKFPFASKLLISSGSTDVLLSGEIPNITTANNSAKLLAVISLNISEQYARLTLVHPSGTCLMASAWRDPWVQVASPALYKAAFAYSTTYAIRLDPGASGPASPEGFGFASFTVGKFGKLTLTGKLPDGSALLGSTYVGNKGEVLIHQPLYGGKGSFTGQLTLVPETPVTDNTVTSDLTWLKPAKPSDTLYKNGFGPIVVTAEGGAYVAPSAGQRLLSLAAAAPTSTNAQLKFSLGEIGASAFNQALRIDNPNPMGLTNTATVAAFNKLATPNPNPNTVKLPKLDAAKGSFSGTFLLPGATAALNRPAPFFGQVVRIGNVTQGWGFFLLPSVPVAPLPAAKAPKYSGVVELTPK